MKNGNPASKKLIDSVINLSNPAIVNSPRNCDSFDYKQSDKHKSEEMNHDNSMNKNKLELVRINGLKSQKNFGIPYFSKMIQAEKEEAGFLRQFEKKLNLIENLTKMNNSKKYEANSVIETRKPQKLRANLSKIGRLDDRYLVNKIQQKFNKSTENQQLLSSKRELADQVSPISSTSRFILTSLGEEIIKDEIQDKKDNNERNYEILAKKEKIYFKNVSAKEKKISENKENKEKSVKFFVENEKIDSKMSNQQFSTNIEDDISYKSNYILQKEKFTLQNLIDSNDKFVDALKKVVDKKYNI